MKNTLDDEPFKDTIAITEEVTKIFSKALGFEKIFLRSVSIGYSMRRIVTFKLKDQFDIDQLESLEEFEFKIQ